MRFDTSRTDGRGPALLAGVLLAVIAAILVVATDVHLAAPVTLLICGITFLTGRRANP